MRQPALATEERTAHAWRRTAVAALAVVVLVVGFIALASALSSADTSFVVAQLISRDDDVSTQPKLVVTGYGRASAPAETATLQLVIGPSGDQFNGGGFRPTPEASPGAGDDSIAMPIVEAIMAQEINRDAISVIVSPVYGDSPYYGGAPLPGFRIDIQLADPDGERLNTLINEVYRVARETGWYVSAQGVVYTAEDCAALERDARSAAIEDGRRQALQQADVLGTELGELIQITDAASPESVLASCSGPGATAHVRSPDNPFAFNPGGGLSAPAYDPAASPEAAVEFRVELTYALPPG
ncbi:MAG TPA: SIMPL domain-containing protein [Thermomicrobiales bacterium]|nr:SIMPL domain-containing protein [Thermomicrobiales bacterium]